MPSQEPTLMLRDVVVRGFLAWDSSIPDGRLQNSRYRSTQLVLQRNYRRAVGLWSTAEAAVDAADERARQIHHNQRLTDEARADATREVVASEGGNAREAAEEIRQLVDASAERLRATMLPPRPQPADAAQEAALANLRSDVAMVLDRLSANEVPERMEAMVREANDEGDALSRWFLVATPWAKRYLESRGAELAGWSNRLPRIVAAVGDDLEEARAMHRVLETLESPKGMLGAVSALDHWIKARLDGASMRLAA
ncbi:MAG: hypothetical protein U5K29_00655 [Acidimicrobiales bacterium]|nr:hypothetical protein [Acidimicrobiales bacterium]